MKEIGTSLGIPLDPPLEMKSHVSSECCFYISDLATAKAVCDLCNLLRVESAREYVHLVQNLGHD